MSTPTLAQRLSDLSRCIRNVDRYAQLAELIDNTDPVVSECARQINDLAIIAKDVLGE